MKIYVIHYDKLKERKSFLEKQFNRQKINPIWFIQKESKPYLSKEISKYYKPDNEEWKRKINTAYTNKWWCSGRELVKSEISLAINHIKIWEKISKGKEDYCLILEDDSILQENFKEKLKKIESLLKEKDWDLCYLEYRGIKNNPNEGFIFFSEKSKTAWGTTAYVIKKETTKKLLRKMSKVTLPIDEELKYLSKELNLKILWVLPALIKEAGTNEGFYSSIEKDRKDKIMNEGSLLNKVSISIRQSMIGRRIINIIKSL